MDYDEIRKSRKKLIYDSLLDSKKENKLPSKISFFISKVLITVIVTLGILIILKKDDKLKATFYKEVYEKNFSFALINNWYQEKFGSTIPFLDLFSDDTLMVFNEKLEYVEANKYLDGVMLSVSENYLVPSYDSGLVIFVGEKDGYGKTVIIETSTGLEVWYGNLSLVNVSLYDYIDKGILIGESNKTLYCVFKKDGKVLDYNDYI